MVERYSIASPSDQLSERFSVESHPHYKPRYNAAPTQLLPVITSGAGSKGISWFYWGRSPEFAHNRHLSEKIINVAAETFHERPVLKRAMMRHRCIIPADGFYGWKKVGKKTSIPYRFTITNQPLFSFAGIWEEFENASGEPEHTFSVITVAANRLIGTVMERMPVILTPEAEKVWLYENARENELMDLLTPYAETHISHYTVSPRINDTRVDVPSLFLHTPPSDQHGNLTLFD
jgi:putative SOS response-associated peptidase YedK